MLRLVRESDKTDIDQDDGIYGKFIFEDKELHSMERPWLPSEEFPSGKSNESCIPVGLYDLVEGFSPKYNKTMYYAVNPDHGVYLRAEDRGNNWERWGCMIHPANWVYQLNGCIAPGTSRGLIGAKYGIGNSKYANSMLYKYIDSMERKQISIEWD